MSDLFGDFVKTAVGGLLGAWFGYVIWIRQQLVELKHTHDKWLSEARFHAYRRLWHSLDTFALYSPAADVGGEELTELGLRLRRIYFVDGVLMSHRVRDVFLFLQECIEVARDLASAPAALRLRLKAVRVDPEQLADFRKTVPVLDRACLVNQRLFDAWLVETKQKARKALLVTSGAPQQQAGVSPSFLTLQYLASSLRTVMTADLNSRDAPVLQPGTSNA